MVVGRLGLLGVEAATLPKQGGDLGRILSCPELGPGEGQLTQGPGPGADPSSFAPGRPGGGWGELLFSHVHPHPGLGKQDGCLGQPLPPTHSLEVAGPPSSPTLHPTFAAKSSPNAGMPC